MRRNKDSYVKHKKIFRYPHFIQSFTMGYSNMYLMFFTWVAENLDHLVELKYKENLRKTIGNTNILPQFIQGADNISLLLLAKRYSNMEIIVGVKTKKDQGIRVMDQN